MGNLIKKVKLSNKQPFVGESIRVEVQVADPAADVMINGIYGAQQYLQFRNPGSFTVVVTASLKKQVEQVGEKVKVRLLNPDVAKAPILWASQDRYHPRTIAFSVANAQAELSNVVGYAWDFGDGTHGAGEDGGISHDYTNALERDRLYTCFDVQVDARFDNGFVTTGKRTISIFNTYALNKLFKGVLTPRVAVQPPLTLPWFFLVGEVICRFTVSNLEDEEITFTAEKHEWLNADPAENPAGGAATEVALQSMTRVGAKAARAAYATPTQVAPVFTAMDLRVPARSSVTVERVLPNTAFTGTTFGVAIHLQGRGMCSQMPAMASAYIEVKLPMQWSGHVIEANSYRVLSSLARSAGLASSVLTHENMGEHFRRAGIAQVLSPEPAPVSADPTISNAVLEQPTVAQPGSSASFKPLAIMDTSSSRFSALLDNLLSPNLVPFDLPTPVVGLECDPDNVPDDLPDGMVCQLTSELAWRYVPGRVLNAKKGDLLLDPGGPGLVGQLLRQVTPAQFYSHCGIMTKNHIEVRHSTGSDDWLKDHLAGNFLGHKGVDGFDPTALKYLWPGTVTQSIDNAYYGEWITSPDTGPYRISDFSFAPDLSDSSTIIYPIVVKPNPFDETAAVRRTLHSIADAALAINGHYRFYCYTESDLGIRAEGVAGADSGWAQGTLATTCSSFIWLAAQHGNVKLEGPGQSTTVTDLEPNDVLRGAAVDGATLDGLYFYTEAERQAAAKWLFQTVYDTAYNKSGFWGTLFTDAPDTVASQLCNTFASDSADPDSVDEDAWKSPGVGHAVSPDNLTFWDSPGSGNQNQFRSVYGYTEEVFYLPGTYAQVPIYRWKLVPTKGTLTGTVTASADVTGANVSLLGSPLQDVVVRADGRFEFDHVPAGRYTVSAGLNIGGYWNSKDVDVQIDAGKTTDVTVPLQPPPEIDRLVTISVEMNTDWSSAFAHSPHYYSGSKSVRVQPFHSHEHIDFQGPDTPTSKIGFDIDLNADLSITVSWTAQEMDDEPEGDAVRGGRAVAKNGSLNWSGLTVVNDDPIDNDATTLSFTVTNAQA